MSSIKQEFPILFKDVEEGESGFTSLNSGIYFYDAEEYVQYEILGFCGCGNPKSAMNYVAEGLRSTLRNQMPIDDADCHLFFLYWANQRGFMEHGSSVYGSWLTPIGQELFRFIEEVGDEKSRQGTT